MGTVWEVEDRERPGLRLALKELTHVTPAGVLLFKEEFRALRDLRHPNVVELDELIECAGEWYLTMELIEGTSFDRYVATAAFPGIPRDEPEALLSRVERSDPKGLLHTGARPASPPSGVVDASSTVRRRSVPRERSKGERRFDESRLRAALAQLGQGVAAMHRAGIVHRDLKPSNVMVDKSGRVVILDFGVVADLGRGTQLAGYTVGTVPYMSPEQEDGNSVTGASDWYSFGVILFRSLTGAAAPFPPGLHRLASQSPWCTSSTEGLPLDLVQLTTSLLRLESHRRPSPEAILSVLGVRDTSATCEYLSDEIPFIGRVQPLARLRRAAVDVRVEGIRALLVSGPSGVGKSALVRAFCRQLQEADDRVLVLVGRCHERESLPYKAFDGVVDDMARTLIRERLTVADLIGHAGATSLLRLFPSLGAAQNDEVGSGAKPTEEEGVDVRNRSFEALVCLLAVLAKTWRVIVTVDDVQWADADSVALLRALTGRRPQCVLVMTARETLQAELVLGAVQCAVERVPLTGLSPAEARELVSALDSSAASLDARALEAIVKESAGHPMFIDELVRQRGGPSGVGGPTERRLDEAILARIDAFQPDTQALLRLVTIAGLPIAQGVLGHAAGFDAAACRRALGELARARLVRMAGARHADTVEPYHDRIREALYSALTPDERRQSHGALARALEANGASASERLAHHYELAGEPAPAASHALTAARAAEKVFAFEQAASLYEVAVRLGDYGAALRAEIFEARGRALQSAGRGRGAAEAYASAADLQEGVTAIDLRRQSAEQLLMSGYVRLGKREAEHVLVALGDSLPRSDVGALFRLGLSLLRVYFSSLRFIPRATPEPCPEAIFRIDTSWSVGAGLSMIDTVVGMHFGILGLTQSLPLGEPFRIARSAATTSVACAAMELGKLAFRAKNLASEAAGIHGSERARCYQEIATMTYSFFCEQRWTLSEQSARSAIETWRQAGMGQGFEFDFTTQFATWCLAMRGDVGALRHEVGGLVRDAEQAGNRFLEVSLRAFHYQTYLVDDDPQEARRNATEAIARWQQEDDPNSFELPHCWTTLSLKSASLYEGRADEGERGVESPLETALWRKIGRSVLWVVGYVRDQVRSLRGRWELTAALAARRAGHHTDARARLRVSRRVGSAIALNAKPVTAAWGEIVLAGVDAAEGNEELAVTRLRRARIAFVATESRLHAAATSARLARIVGGDEGATFAAEAAAYFTKENVRSPERMTAFLLPWP